MALNDNIKRFRELRGLSVPDLAKKMGIDKAGIYKWEDGTTVPGGNKLTAIADALGVTVADLLGENPTSVQIEPAVSEKTELINTFREVLEGGTEYRLVLRTVLEGEYRIMPKSELDKYEKQFDKIDQRTQLALNAKDEVIGMKDILLRQREAEIERLRLELDAARQKTQ